MTTPGRGLHSGRSEEVAATEGEERCCDGSCGGGVETAFPDEMGKVDAAVSRCRQKLTGASLRRCNGLPRLQSLNHSFKPLVETWAAEEGEEPSVLLEEQDFTAVTFRAISYSPPLPIREDSMQNAEASEDIPY